jgi:asparagine synthase (glutamine-hydrolysing)
MGTEDGTAWIVHNGEVYNYVELRAELERLGYGFRSRSDTEVILASYLEWGEDCLARFNGMFAFLIVDLKRGCVFAARDRLGIKPLYLWRGHGFVAVVSEIKELTTFPAFRPRPRKQQLVDFLVDGVVNHRPDSCFFEEVFPLPPGHWLRWSISDLPEVERSRPYWTPPTERRDITWDEAVEKTGILVRDAVAVRLRSDVPVGSCLSGGVDSSTIVGVACRDLGRRMTTITSCFPGTPFDEEKYAEAVGRHCGTEFLRVFPSMDQALSDLEDLVYGQDEPFSSLSIFAQWCVMREARRAGVPVLLDGQGGDELLCGYRKYAWFRAGALLRRKRYAQAISHLARVLTNGDRGILDFSKGARYLPPWLRVKTKNLLRMLRAEYRVQRMPLRYNPADRGEGSVRRRVEDLTKWSLPSLLRYEDRNSMAHGIETRLPLLDYRLVEHFLSIPEEYFFRAGRTKRLLVEAVRHALPGAVIRRRTKVGFETAQDEWMKSDLGRVLEDYVGRSPLLASIMDEKAAAREFVAYREGSASLPGETLWRIAGLALWAERFRIEV